MIQTSCGGQTSEEGGPTLYLTRSSVQNVRQELQLSDRPDLCGHVNHSEQLSAVQTPEVQQVGATTGSKAPAIPGNTRSVYHSSSFLGVGAEHVATLKAAVWWLVVCETHCETAKAL